MNFYFNGSPSAQIGILAELEPYINKIIYDFVTNGKVDPDWDNSDYQGHLVFVSNDSHPLAKAIFIFGRLIIGNKKILPHADYEYLMSYRELMSIEKPPVETNEQKQFLQALKFYTELLKEAMANVDSERIALFKKYEKYE